MDDQYEAEPEPRQIRHDSQVQYYHWAPKHKRILCLLYQVCRLPLIHVTAMEAAVADQQYDDC